MGAGLVKARGSGPSQRIPSLDGLRAVSIAIVVGYHCLNAASWRITGHDYEGAWRIFFVGRLGVSVFFVISGYLITHLLIREVNKTGKIDLRDFYIRRTFRIWPAFYVYLTAVVCLHLFKVIGINAKRDLLSSALFAFNYVPRAGSTWVGHTWSLAVEEQFYLIWPIVLLLIGFRRSRFAAIAIILATPVIRLLEVSWFPKEGYLVSRLWEMSHTRFDTIMVGCLISLLWDNLKFNRIVNWILSRHGAWIALVILLANGPLLERFASPAVTACLVYSIEACCVGLLMIWAVRNSGSLAGRFLNSRVMVHLGTVSYSLYLWNALFCTPLNKTWSGQFPANILCVLIMAEISRVLVEQPFLALRNRLFRNPGKSRGQESPAVPERVFVSVAKGLRNSEKITPQPSNQLEVA